MKPCEAIIKEELSRLVQRIVQGYGPDQIILFGSYAYGLPDRDSDVDLLIVKDTKEIPFDRRVTIRRICQDPNRHIPFQPLVVTPGELEARLRMGDPFFREIVQKGEVLYAREGISSSQGLV